VRNWRPSIIGGGVADFPIGKMRRDDVVVEYSAVPFMPMCCSGVRRRDVGMVIVRPGVKVRVMLPLNL
jgi:hypothetical protein